MAFQHFLITRINLGYKSRIKTQGYKEEFWLDYRFDLFYKTCFPSVLNQKNKNFQWLIYLDITTPTIYVLQLVEKLQKFPHVEIILREGNFGDLAYYVPVDIGKKLFPAIEYVITSRIDSDDLIHQDYIQEVQNQFDHQKYMSVNFTFGLVYDINRGLLGKAKNRSNPFISLIESCKQGKLILSVCYQSHTEFLFEKSRMEILNKKRLWCMNMHDVNDSTKFYGLPIFSSLHNLDQEFNFKFHKRTPLKLKFIYSLKYFKRQGKKVLHYLIKKNNH